MRLRRPGETPALSYTWPFDPTRLPFRYAWIIFAITTLGVVVRIPANSTGLAVFTEPWMAALDMNRTQISSAYFMGTLLTALLMPIAGKLYDKLGGRTMITLSSIGLGLAFAAIGCFGDIVERFALGSDGKVILMTAGYLSVGLFGQGVMTSCCRNVLMVWFPFHRGPVSSAQNLIMAVAFAAAPLLLVSMIGSYGWEKSAFIIAAVIGLGYSVLSVLFTRDHPLLVATTDDEIDASTAEEFIDVGFTRPEALRTMHFWLYSGSIAFLFMANGAILFHAQSIFEEAGYGAEMAFAWLLPSTVISIGSMLVCSALVDKNRMRPFLIAMILGFLPAVWGLLHLSTTWGYWMMACSFGFSGGIRGILMNVVFIRLFGAKHVGAISSVHTSSTLVAGAIGPAVFAGFHQVFGHYQGAMMALGVIAVVLLIAALAIPRLEMRDLVEIEKLQKAT